MENGFFYIFLAVGIGGFLSVLGKSAWERGRRRRRFLSRCEACRRRYDASESLACVPEWYCCEACEVTALEHMAEEVRR